jgi:hypothetical protein
MFKGPFVLTRNEGASMGMSRNEELDGAALAAVADGPVVLQPSGEVVAAP